MKPRCLFVMDPQFFPLLFGPGELARLEAQVQVGRRPCNAAELAAPRPDFADVEVIIASWGMPPLDDALLGRFPRLKAVFYAAGSVRSIVTDASWARGIRVTNASWANALPTAEFSFAAIIFSLKRAWASMAALRAHQVFERYTPAVRGSFRSTVGLLSLGKIGRTVAGRLATLDVNVMAYDPFVPEEDARRLGVSLASLDEVFSTADVVSCHMPLTDDTHQSLGHEHFATMKIGATFINTARGALVREAELVTVLTTRPDLFAVLDVMESEPPVADCPLLKLPNVVATPHIAGSIGQECRRMGLMMVDEVGRYLNKEPLVGEISQEQVAMLA